MKGKMIYIGLVCLLLASCSNEKTINFVQKQSFSEVLQMADTSNKAVFLYVWTKGNEIASVLNSQVFTDEEIRDYFNGHFVNYAICADDAKWADLVAGYGILNYPVMLMLTPQGDIILDIVGLGKIGYDETGNLPCRRAILRQAGIAARYMTDDDSTFFARDNWKKIDQSFVRLDSKLFERIMLNKEMLQQRYNKGFDVLVDFSMSAAAVNLIIQKEDQAPTRNEYRIKAYFDALERYEIDNKARYKLYADVNIAYGMDDIQEAARVADAAYNAGTITETEYRQLKYSLGAD